MCPTMCFNFVLRSRAWNCLPGHSQSFVESNLLKPFAIPPFNIIQQTRTDVEANVEAVCSGITVYPFWFTQAEFHVTFPRRGETAEYPATYLHLTE